MFKNRSYGFEKGNSQKLFLNIYFNFSCKPIIQKVHEHHNYVLSFKDFLHSTSSINDFLNNSSNVISLISFATTIKRLFFSLT